ncbi:MAG: hypothetical protein K2X48_13075 [Chitinophagaceae bacterium]|nr:hypothetical protein [Chitinophagaceae bacterium]
MPEVLKTNMSFVLSCVLFVSVLFIRLLVLWWEVKELRPQKQQAKAVQNHPAKKKIIQPPLPLNRKTAAA